MFLSSPNELTSAPYAIGDRITPAIPGLFNDAKSVIELLQQFQRLCNDAQSVIELLQQFQRLRNDAKFLRA